LSKFKALLVGAGAMGKAWGRNLAACDQVEIVGWVDIRSEAAAHAVEEQKLADVFTTDDLGKALYETRPDFVVDVTIPEAHHAVTMQSLAAGVPVLGEKPLADSLENAREMVAASEKAGKLFMVSQSRRYDARLQAFRRLIDSHVGPLGILNSDFYIGAHFGGFREQMPSPLLLDMAIHTLDAARYLCDADPVAVYCDEFNPAWSWYEGDVSATAIFEMTNGLRYTYRGSWCAEGKSTSWESEWRAVGPNGTATWDGVGAPLADIVTEAVGFHHKTEAQTVEIAEIMGGISGALRDFLHALETGESPMGECHDNIKSLAMVFAAIESAALKQRVPVCV
jgi:predicted dehydrogenase